MHILLISFITIAFTLASFLSWFFYTESERSSIYTFWLWRYVSTVAAVPFLVWIMIYAIIPMETKVITVDVPEIKQQEGFEHHVRKLQITVYRSPHCGIYHRKKDIKVAP